MPLHPRDAQIIDDIIWREGGGTYTNDPADAGGPTRWGITQNALARHRGHPVTASDVQDLSREEAAEIYEGIYIRPFDGLPIGLRENVIDMAVNAGVGRATRLLQQLVGARVDGAIGPQTLRLAMKADWNDGFAYMRIAYYEDLIERIPTNIKWRNGWRARALSFLASPLSRQGLMAMTIPAERVGKCDEGPHA